MQFRHIPTFCARRRAIFLLFLPTGTGKTRTTVLVRQTKGHAPYRPLLWQSVPHGTRFPAAWTSRCGDFTLQCALQGKIAVRIPPAARILRLRTRENSRLRNFLSFQNTKPCQKPCDPRHKRIDKRTDTGGKQQTLSGKRHQRKERSPYENA